MDRQYDRQIVGLKARQIFSYQARQILAKKKREIDSRIGKQINGKIEKYEKRIDIYNLYSKIDRNIDRQIVGNVDS